MKYALLCFFVEALFALVFYLVAKGLSLDDFYKGYATGMGAMLGGNLASSFYSGFIDRKDEN